MKIDYNGIEKDNDCTKVEDVAPGEIFRPYGEEGLYLMTSDYESFDLETGAMGGWECETPVQIVYGKYVVEGFSD